MNPFQFKNPENLWWLFLLPFLSIVFVFFRRMAAKKRADFGERDLLLPLLAEHSKYRDIFKEIVFLFAFAFLILAAARPQIGSKIKVEQQGSGELVMALDVSNSMLAEDISPNRLSRAKKMIAEIYNTFDAKMGLILFAGDAYVQIPMTSGVASADVFLASISPESVPVQGTDFSAAIELGAAMFDKSTKAGKNILIFTDGEDHEAKAIEAAKNATKSGIKIHTIGVGKERAAPIVDPFTGSYKKDRNNNPVLTKLNPVLLQEIANAGGGKYIRAGNMFADLEAIKTLVAAEGEDGQEQTIEEYADLFPLFVSLSLILLCIEFLLLDRQNERLSRMFV